MDDDRDRPNFFAGPYIDRRGELREDAGWRDAALADISTLYIVSRGTTHLLLPEPEPRIAFVTREQVLTLNLDESSFVLLGWFRGTRCVLIDLDPDKSRGEEAIASPSARFEELRPLTNVLPADEAGLLSYARALSIWRSRNRFCGRCSAPTVAERGGHVLRCSNAACGQEVFPRIDPAIIVLVSDGERALLGRQSTWPKGRYSTIAGFVEPGESLEDAVAREVMEETGVEVIRSRYHSSQPWPFPSSLMIGYQAVARPGSQVRIGGELEDARWFTRAEMLGNPPMMPPSQAISYRLIRAWLDTKPG
jgi:NAD+ diphosphatase